MNILTNIIRGGQLTLHALRMFKQVFGYIMLWATLILLIFFSLNMYDNVTKNIWIGFRDYQAANIMCHLMMCSKKLTVYFGPYPSVVTARNVLTTSFFYTSNQTMWQLALESLIFAARMASIGLGVVSAFFIWRGFKKTGDEFKRGAKLSGFEKVKSDITKKNKKVNYDAYKIAGMPYPFLTESQHTFVVGANGTGKTVLISEIVEQIRARGDKAIIYDKKGDYTKWFYDSSKDKLLNPFDQRSQSWSLLSEIDNITNVKQIAAAFLPDKENQGGDNKIWNEAGRIAFTEIVNKLHADGEILTNREIVDKVLKTSIEKASELLQNTYAQSIIDDKSPKTAASVLFVLASHFNSLKLTNSKPDSSFSIRDWILNDEQDSMLFITSQESLSQELSPLQTAWMEIVISAILSKQDDDNSKTWVIMDELPAMNKIPSLADALATTRSFGGCIVLGMQNIAQIRDIYGRNGAQNISSECNTRCIFKSNDSDTAKWMSETIGEVEISEFKEGLSYGANTIRDGVTLSKQDKVKPLLLPSEITNMKALELILKMPDNPAIKSKLKYKHRKKVEEKYIQDEQVIEDLKSAYADVEEIKGETKIQENEKNIKSTSKIYVKDNQVF